MDDALIALLQDIRDELRLVRIHLMPETADYRSLNSIPAFGIVHKNLERAAEFLVRVRAITPEELAADAAAQVAWEISWREIERRELEREQFDERQASHLSSDAAASEPT